MRLLGFFAVFLLLLLISNISFAVPQYCISQPGLPACKDLCKQTPSDPFCQHYYPAKSSGSEPSNEPPQGFSEPDSSSQTSCTSDASGGKKIACALLDICKSMKQALAVGVILMVVLSAIIYGLGQTLGAETRARMVVWATAMFTGSIVAVLIYILVPYIIQILMGDPSLTVEKYCS